MKAPTRISQYYQLIILFEALIKEANSSLAFLPYSRTDGDSLGSVYQKLAINWLH